MYVCRGSICPYYHSSLIMSFNNSLSFFGLSTQGLMMLKHNLFLSSMVWPPPSHSFLWLLLPPAKLIVVFSCSMTCSCRNQEVFLVSSPPMLQRRDKIRSGISRPVKEGTARTTLRCPSTWAINAATAPRRTLARSSI